LNSPARGSGLPAMPAAPRQALEIGLELGEGVCV